MNQKKPSIREKIIIAAIDCIEQYGVESVTIRLIGAKAGVNSAAISYYFGSKESLIQEALSRTLEEFKKMPEGILKADDLDSKKLLPAFFEALFEGMIRWPRVVKAHLCAPLFDGDYMTPFADTFNSFLTNLLRQLEKMPLEQNKSNLRLRIVQSISAVLIPGLMPGLFQYFAGLDFTDPESRRLYLEDLAGRFFSNT